MKQILAVMLSVSAMVAACHAAAQTTYPEKRIRLVVSFPPGSQVDVVARLLGQKFTEASGKPVLIDNAAGAAGSIGADRVAKAAPDGYTLGLLGQTQIVINPGLYKLPYDPVRDFAPVSQVFASPIMLVVHNALPARNVQELIKLAKAQPGELTFASGGSGGSAHMTAALLASVAGLDILHVPYKGAATAIPDLLGGRVTMMFSPIAIVLPLARVEKLRALAVTSSQRSPAAPELPTIAESGYPGFEVTAWYGLVAPARTPASIVRRLHVDTVNALALRDLSARLADLGLEGIGNSPDEFAAAIKSETPRWAKVIKESGIKPE